MKAQSAVILVSSFFVHCVTVASSDIASEFPPDDAPVFSLLSDDNDCENANQLTESTSTGSKTKAQTIKNNLKSACNFPALKPMDCEELQQLGYIKSGVYNVWPKNKIINNEPIRVFCDMETDNGGWTVIQRRGNFLYASDYFYKDWESYKNGFGNIEKEFWLGNDNIFALTNQRQYSVRFDLTDMEGNYRYALYDIFFIENEENKYQLTIQDYSGTANDSMADSHNGMKFSTKDQDNDINKNSCAEEFKGAWWYAACHKANLNGLNRRGKHESFADGINWFSWKGYHESLDKTEIKIRPKEFLKLPMD